MNKEENRIEILKAMHTIMTYMNNENAYWSWVTLGVPDEPQEDDFESIAEDEDSFNEVAEHFTEVFKEYSKDGFAV
jgi:hypothetical protein